jgi:hypothetical protein
MATVLAIKTPECGAGKHSQCLHRPLKMKHTRVVCGCKCHTTSSQLDLWANPSTPVSSAA